jgi:UDP-N-acetylglucosamine--N-acetylmuramyl-(pentapeptide) pyrophosphoryl-undecaprenol N-acetylglucosamine transferase
VQGKSYSVVFAGGGTGGHLFPALVVAAELQRRHAAATISFIGAERGLEQRLVPQAGYRLRTLRLSGIKGRSLAGRAAAVLAAGWAVLRSVLWMLASRPDLVIGVGGYASGPAVLAAKLLKVRTMVLEQNHYPGATNRWLAPRVDAVCLPSADAQLRMGGLGRVTGNPVRPEFLSIGEPPLAPRLSLLVFGGSRGARSINRAMGEALAVLAAIDPPPRIVHQTGADDEEAVRTAYRDYPAEHCEILAFLDDMPARLAAADLVICRAGATTLAELTVAGRASILVPFPFAADDHQRHNAEAMQQAGAAEMVLDAQLSGEILSRKITRLVAERENIRSMGRSAQRLARPRAAEAIADVADRLLGAQSGRDGDVS